MSYLFFVGGRVYKLKKPIVTDFVDFSSVNARRHACEEEVGLNRRLTPDVYLGVSAVLDPRGSVCDHLVVMRRMPDERSLETLVVSGDPGVTTQLQQVASVVARFHTGARRSKSIDRAGRREHVAHLWESNTAALSAYGPDIIEPSLVDRVDRLARRYVDGRAPLFERRVRERRIVDGHGDLLASDIFCLDDGPRILDCLEFDATLRYGDALADIAFLAMDLERLGRPDLAAAFLDAYREASGDSWPDSLAHHWIAYRAQVRAKVAALRATQSTATYSRDGRQLLDLAADHLRAAIPRLVLVGGLPGTGKSTLAAGIAKLLRWPVLRSDVVRKQLQGINPFTPAGADYECGLYRPAVNRATYAELLRQARELISNGMDVLIDASWTDRGDRQEAKRLAADTGAHLVELCCTAPAGTADRRINARAVLGRDPSDATPGVAVMMASRADPWLEAATIDTSGSESDSLVGALAELDRSQPEDEP